MEMAFPAWGTLAPSILPRPFVASDRPTTHVGKGATLPAQLFTSLVRMTDIVGKNRASPAGSVRTTRVCMNSSRSSNLIHFLMRRLSRLYTRINPKADEQPRQQKYTIIVINPRSITITSLHSVNLDIRTPRTFCHRRDSHL